MDSGTEEQLPNRSEASLIRRSQNGDVDAFEQLVRRYEAPLLSFLRYFAANASEVEDAAQDAFLKCFLHIDQVDPDRGFKNWLYTIARRTLAEKKLAGNPVDLNTCLEIAGSVDDPHKSAESADQKDSIWRTVRSLTNDDEFQLMWFRYAEQFTIKEVAMLMQRSPAALKMQLSRLRTRLRPHLKPFADDSPVEKKSMDPINKAA